MSESAQIEPFLRVAEATDGSGLNIVVGSYGVFFPKESEVQARFLVEHANRVHDQLRTALAEMVVEFVAAHKEGSISTMPQTAQRIIRNAEKCFGHQQCLPTDKP